MASAQALRDQATRLFALAIEARAKGNIQFANLLIDAAAKDLDQATAAETTDAIGSPPSPPQHPPVVQQQQQIEPDKGEPDGQN